MAKHEAALFAHLAGNSRLLLDSDLTQSWEDQVNGRGRKAIKACVNDNNHYLK